MGFLLVGEEGHLIRSVRHMTPTVLEGHSKGDFEMRSCLLLVSIATLLALAPRASAEIKFFCHAAAPDECAFAVTPADGAYVTNFVLGANQTHSVNDGFAGGKYCVVVSKPRAQV